MYNSNMAHSLNSNKIVKGGNTLIDLFKLSVTAGWHAGVKDDVDLSFLLSSVFKGQTVIDIGSHRGRYLYKMLKRVGSAGKVVAFECQPFLYNYYTKISRLMRWSNIRIEPASFFGSVNRLCNSRNDKPQQNVPVINLEAWANSKQENSARPNTLDHYCSTYTLQPDFIRINTNGNCLKVLQGATKVIENHRPTFMICCEERSFGRQQVLETFKFFADLNYKGFFILETIKIPLENFEFDLYQNPRNNFYCNHFIFE
jgi:FkbM family methyltransferase